MSNDLTFLNDVTIKVKSEDFGNQIRITARGIVDEEPVLLAFGPMFRDTAALIRDGLIGELGAQVIEPGEEVTQLHNGQVVPTAMHREPRIYCRTVGQLIEQLRRLPAYLPLSAFEGVGLQPIVANVKSGKPFVVVDELSEDDIESDSPPPPEEEECNENEALTERDLRF